MNIGTGKIYTPNALPMFRDEETVGGSGGKPTSKKRHHEKMRDDPILSKKPFKPSGPDTKVIAGSTLSSYADPNSFYLCTQHNAPCVL